MPFGRYVGQPLREVPDDYLTWLARSIELYEPLKSAVVAEIHYREQPQRPNPAGQQLDVRAWFRRMSLQFHPDHGGSAEAMKALEAGRKLLEEMLGG